MSKLIIFDLDGVLIDTCDIHFDTFNQALNSVNLPVLTREEHMLHYNGLPTRGKLMKLGVPSDLHETIFRNKQKATAWAMTTNLRPNEAHQKMIKQLKADGYLVACATNCIRQTVDAALSAIGILDLMDLVVANEDVVHPKPSPAIYLKTMSVLGVSPHNTTIFEDSYVGLCAATQSGARVCHVPTPESLTLDFVRARQTVASKINIVVPMAGNGSRFANAGYKDPKPFIPVRGKPMISWVVDNLGLDAHYIFLVRKEVMESYRAREYLQTIAPGCDIVEVDQLTEGAACTVLLAKQYLDENPLMIINSDQYIEFSAMQFVVDFLHHPTEKLMDGKISTFDGGRSPKWSYANVEDGLVTEVREKDPFSDHATTGLYMWRRGTDFVKYAEQMIAKNIRVNNEFYVVPTFNEAIQDGKKFVVSDCARMWGIGVPEDLEFFLTNFRAVE